MSVDRAQVSVGHPRVWRLPREATPKDRKAGGFLIPLVPRVPVLGTTLAFGYLGAGRTEH